MRNSRFQFLSILDLSPKNCFVNRLAKLFNGRRIRILQMALNAIERLMNAGPISAEHLRGLQSLIQSAEAQSLDPAPIRRALMCERAVFIESACDSASIIAARGANWLGTGVPAPIQPAVSVMKLTGQWEVAVADELSFRNNEIDLFAFPLEERKHRAQQLEAWEINRAGLGQFSQIQQLLSIQRANTHKYLVVEQLSAIARLRATQTALAIELWRAAKESPTSAPEKLDELVPQFLAQIPADPFDGKPLRYARQKAGYIVYSLGPSGVDNGGQINLKRARSEDPAFIVER